MEGGHDPLPECSKLLPLTDNATVVKTDLLSNDFELDAALRKARAQVDVARDIGLPPHRGAVLTFLASLRLLFEQPVGEPSRALNEEEMFRLGAILTVLGHWIVPVSPSCADTSVHQANTISCCRAYGSDGELHVTVTMSELVAQSQRSAAALEAAKLAHQRDIRELEEMNNKLAAEVDALTDVAGGMLTISDLANSSKAIRTPSAVPVPFDKGKAQRTDRPSSIPLKMSYGSPPPGNTTRSLSLDVERRRSLRGKAQPGDRFGELHQQTRQRHGSLCDSPRRKASVDRSTWSAPQASRNDVEVDASSASQIASTPSRSSQDACSKDVVSSRHVCSAFAPRARLKDVDDSDERSCGAAFPLPVTGMPLDLRSCSNHAASGGDSAVVLPSESNAVQMTINSTSAKAACSVTTACKRQPMPVSVSSSATRRSSRQTCPPVLSGRASRNSTAQQVHKAAYVWGADSR